MPCQDAVPVFAAHPHVPVSPAERVLRAVVAEGCSLNVIAILHVGNLVLRADSPSPVLRLYEVISMGFNLRI